MSLFRCAFQLAQQLANQGRELERKDLVLRLGMSSDMATKIIGQLKATHCIEFAYGSCRRGVFYRFVPGAHLPPDGRGMSENSRKALQRKAARPPGNRHETPLNAREEDWPIGST